MSIQPGATFYFGLRGNRIDGLIINEGTLVYKHTPGNSNPDFTAYSNFIGDGFVIGNGTIRYTGGSGGIIPSFKSGNNTFEVRLNNTADNLMLGGCNAFRNVNFVVLMLHQQTGLHY